MTASTLPVPATDTSTWTIDAAHSQVEFAVKHLMISTVKGRIPAIEGTVTLHEANPTASTVSVEFDAASIDTGTPMRDDHLRAADFFDVATFPKISFRSIDVGATALEDGAEFPVTGELTIRGVPRSVQLKVTVNGRGRDPFGNDRIAFSAVTTIDRRDFGLHYNAALETGGVMVGHEVKITIKVEAIRAS
jgi:polyisoprenoid-binding protein YceI